MPTNPRIKSVVWLACVTLLTASACGEDDAKPDPSTLPGGSGGGGSHAGGGATGATAGTAGERGPAPNDAGGGGVAGAGANGADGGAPEAGAGDGGSTDGGTGPTDDLGNFRGPALDDQAPILLGKDKIVDTGLTPQRVEQDAAGNIFVQLSGGGPGPAPAATFPPLRIGGFARLDAKGSRVWTLNSTAPALTGKTVWSAALTKSGRLLFGGAVDAALPGETHAGSSDAFVAELDGDGALLWQHQWGSAGIETNEFVASNADDSVLAVASCAGQAPGNPATNAGGPVLTRYDASGLRTILKQYEPAQLANTSRSFVDSSGTLLWVKSLMLGKLDSTGLASVASSSPPSLAHALALATDEKSFYGTETAALENLSLSGLVTWARLAEERTAVIEPVEGVTWHGTVTDCRTIQPTSDALYVTGIYDNTYMNGSVPHKPTTTLFVARFTLNGRQQWFQQFLLDQNPISNAAPTTPRLAWVLAPDAQGNPSVLLRGDGPIMNAQSVYSAGPALYLVKLSKLDGSLL